MASIEEVLKARDEHYEKTGEWLDYGNAYARFEHLHSTPIPAGEGPNSKRRVTTSATGQRSSRPWLLPEEKKEIKIQFLNGSPVKDIAASVGVSPPTVVNHLKAMGLYTYEPPKSWTTEEEELLRDFYFHDVPISDIAGMLHRTENSIRSKINKLGLNVQKKNRSGTAIPKAASKN